MENKVTKERFPVGTHLNKDERDALDIILFEEKDKYKKALPDVNPDRIVSDSSFIRGLIKKEIKKRIRLTKKHNKDYGKAK